MLSFLFQVSRPRFWMYLIGPYLIGIGASQDFNTAVALNPLIWFWLLYFSFPGNLFIYESGRIAANMICDEFNVSYVKPKPLKA